MPIQKPDYGIDAPVVIHNLALAGTLALGACIGLAVFSESLLRTIGLWYCSFLAVMLLAPACWMLYSNRRGRYRMVQEIIHQSVLKGHERILNVGCGRGLLLIEMAKKLPRGQATGIDIWHAGGLTGHHSETTRANSTIEGVADRVVVLSAAMTAMPFADHLFDVVVSSMAIHNVPSPEARRIALAEIVRVTKPSGTILLQDFQYTQVYLEVLESLGCTGTKLSPWKCHVFPPVRTVSATAPSEAVKE